MTSMTRDMLLSLISSRTDYACDRVSENPEYQAICRQLGKADKEIVKLFERFTEYEKAAIRQYEEDETHKETFEIREVYLQGIRDCFKLIAFLSDFQSEVQEL